MKEKYSLIFKILILIVSGLGLYLNFRLFNVKDLLPFFTIISNLLCFIVYLIIVILMIFKKLKKTESYYIIKGMSTMGITLTMCVYQLILAPNGLDIYETHILECELVHLIVPLLIIIDYFVFAEKGNVKKTYPIYWISIVIIYLLFVIIYSSLGGTFNGEHVPYFFLDINKLGIFRVILYCVMILIFYIGCGHIAYLIDNKYKKKNTNK